MDYIREQRKFQYRDNNRTSANKTKWSFLKSIIDENTAHSVKNLLTKLTHDQYEEIFAIFGANWKTTAAQIIEAKQSEETNRIVAQNFIHFSKSQAGPINEDAMKWLETLFNKNKITPADFYSWFITIVDKSMPKVNTFVIKGRPNTGKSLITNLLLQDYPQARITRQGELSPFHLSNLVTKTIGIFEEPRILPTTGS